MTKEPELKLGLDGKTDVQPKLILEQPANFITTQNDLEKDAGQVISDFQAEKKQQLNALGRLSEQPGPELSAALKNLDSQAQAAQAELEGNLANLSKDKGLSPEQYSPYPLISKEKITALENSIREKIKFYKKIADEQKKLGHTEYQQEMLKAAEEEEGLISSHVNDARQYNDAIRSLYIERVDLFDYAPKKMGLNINKDMDSVEIMNRVTRWIAEKRNRIVNFLAEYQAKRPQPKYFSATEEDNGSDSEEDQKSIPTSEKNPDQAPVTKDVDPSDEIKRLLLTKLQQDETVAGVLKMGNDIRFAQNKSGELIIMAHENGKLKALKGFAINELPPDVRELMGQLEETHYTIDKDVPKQEKATATA